MWVFDVVLATCLLAIVLFYEAMVHTAQPDPITEPEDAVTSTNQRHQTV